MVIVALGHVYIPSEKEIIYINGSVLAHDCRQVVITDDLVPNAQLPCPTSEMTFVYEGKNTLLAWPSNLVLPRNKVCY